MISIYFRVLSLGWALIISYFSLLPRAAAITTSLGDKVEHFIGYCALAILANLGWKSSKTTTFFCILFGIAIEVAQGFEGSRTPSILDAIANSLGAIAGMILILYLRKKYAKMDHIR